MAGIIFPTPELIIPISKLLCPILAYPFWPGLKVPAPSAGGITVVNVFENSSNGSAFNVSLSGAQSGDVVYAFHAGASNASYPSGYTGLQTLDVFGDTTVYFNTSRKVLTGADTTVAFPANGFPSTLGAAGGCVLVRGVNNSTPEDATPTSVGFDSGQPDSPAITTVTAGSLIISAFCALTNADGTFTEPSGYGNKIDIFGDATYDIGLGVASLLVGAAGTYNPGAWSGVTFGVVPDWQSVTIAVRPA